MAVSSLVSRVDTKERIVKKMKMAVLGSSTFVAVSLWAMTIASAGASWD